MKTLSLCYLLLTGSILFSCNFTHTPNEVNASARDSTIQVEPEINTGPVRFDFTASRLIEQPDIIEVKAWLINDLADTVYYVSTSCNGEQYALEFDTVKYTVIPLMDCDVDTSVVRIIPPLSRHTFEARLRASTKDERIRLGFDFFRTQKGTTVTGMTSDRIYGNDTDNNILWAEERRFE
jgi:hypothetical protein